MLMLVPLIMIMIMIMAMPTKASRAAVGWPQIKPASPVEWRDWQ